MKKGTKILVGVSVIAVAIIVYYLATKSLRNKCSKCEKQLASSKKNTQNVIDSCKAKTGLEIVIK